MKSRKILLNTFHLFQVYVIVLMGIVFPTVKIDLAFTLMSSFIGYWLICLCPDKYRKGAMAGLSILLGLVNYLTQPTVLAAAAVTVYHVLLLMSYHLNNRDSVIKGSQVAIVMVVTLIMASVLNFFFKTNESLAPVYNSLLSYLIIGIAVGVINNIDLFYRLPFVNVLDETNRIVIENIILIIAIIVLIFQSQVFNLALEILITILAVLLRGVGYFLKGLLYIGVLLLKLLSAWFPWLFRYNPSDLDQLIEHFDAFDNLGNQYQNYVNRSNTQLITNVAAFGLIAIVLGIIAFIFKNRQEEKMELVNEGNVRMVKTALSRTEEKKEKRKLFGGRLSEVRRRYRRTVNKLIQEDYQFPEHITANEYLTTVRERDREKYDFSKLTEMYNEDRYGGQDD
ncbi:MAG: hypothetical protein II161_00085 [Erysipelotrichaceae bacterium]|nr:hypothetical protein [Erysipelotrichaceae bacterium]MBQ4252970.1 hypothetical protein [Erysipelotrichaceae bacterium]